MEILIAAKERIVRSALAFLINCNGYNDNTISAADPISLLQRLKTCDFDLVLLEWGFFFEELPGMMTLLKKAYPDVVFVVTGIKKENKKEVFDAKMDAFYLKSDPSSDLLKIINSFRKEKSYI